MAVVPPVEHPVWRNIVTGKVIIDFQFVAANILMMSISSNIGHNTSSSDIERYCTELRDLFIENIYNPAAQQDIGRIAESGPKERIMFDLKSVQDMILNGQRLMLAGDERLLSQLPMGQWIGGTIPYFISINGGVFSQELIAVTKLPDYCGSIKIRTYDEKSLGNVYVDAPNNGFSLIIIPALSRTHLSFALNAPGYKHFADQFPGNQQHVVTRIK